MPIASQNDWSRREGTSSGRSAPRMLTVIVLPRPPFAFSARHVRATRADRSEQHVAGQQRQIGAPVSGSNDHRCGRPPTAFYCQSAAQPGIRDGARGLRARRRRAPLSSAAWPSVEKARQQLSCRRRGFASEARCATPRRELAPGILERRARCRTRRRSGRCAPAPSSRRTPRRGHRIAIVGRVAQTVLAFPRRLCSFLELHQSRRCSLQLALGSD